MPVDLFVLCRAPTGSAYGSGMALQRLGYAELASQHNIDSLQNREDRAYILKYRRKRNVVAEVKRMI